LLELNHSARDTFFGGKVIRVHLSGVVTMCTGGAGDWAYINTDAGNYKSTVAALILAHQTGKSVTIYTNRGAQNYCQMGHLMVQ
jgi:hypothetical protein